MNHPMTQPRQGRHIPKMPLLTELGFWLDRVSRNMPRRWRWELGWTVFLEICRAAGAGNSALPPRRLARLYERKHAALEALKKSLLHQAFTGAL